MVCANPIPEALRLLNQQEAAFQSIMFMRQCLESGQVRQLTDTILSETGLLLRRFTDGDDDLLHLVRWCRNHRLPERRARFLCRAAECLPLETDRDRLTAVLKSAHLIPMTVKG